MAQAGNIANKYLKSWCGLTPYITIGTGAPVRLRLWVFESQPTYEERWVEHRGRRRRRRYYHSQMDKICLTQLEAGETTVHTFVLPPHQPGFVVWLVYADTCNFNTATFTSPIWSFTYTACDGSSPFIARSHTIGESFPNLLPTNLDWNTYVEGNPAMEFNSQFTEILVTLYYTIQVFGTIRADFQATPPAQEGFVALYSNGGSTTELTRQTIILEAPRATTPLYLEWTGQLSAGDVVWCEGTTTSAGPNQLTILGSDQSDRLFKVSALQ